MKTILGIFAHPDDEVFAAGGVMAKCAAKGDRAVLICATKGEAGEISDPALATRENLAEVRTAEVQAAVAALGIHKLYFLGFRDSGMVGTPENEDLRCLHKADPGEAVHRLVLLLCNIQPDIVITHDPTGGYGHPDHIAVCKHVTSAYEIVRDGLGELVSGEGKSHGGETWRLSKLFYQVIPKSFFRQMLAQMQAAGADTTQWTNMGFDKLGVEEGEITHAIDVSAQFEQKMAAYDAHRTQFGPDNPMRKMPEEMRRQTFATETFIQVVPPALQGQPWRTDLFDLSFRA